MSFKTSVLIWFSHFRGIASPPAPLLQRGGRLTGWGFCIRQKNILFNGISFEDRVEERNTKDYRNWFTYFETSEWYIKLEDVFN